MQEPAPSSRHLHAGRHLGSQQAPPRLIPGLQSIPGFDAIFVFRHVISGSLSLAFLAHTCRAQRRDFSVTLTTTTLYRSSSRWFAASACTTAAEGHRAERPAPPSHAQHRIQNLGLLHPASFNVRGTPPDDARQRGPPELRLLLSPGIAVGTAVADRPPRRSQRARLTHWALALGASVKAHARPWMLDAGDRYPSGSEAIYALPRQAGALASAP